MPDFEVLVEKYMYFQGTYPVSAPTEGEARAIVRDMITKGCLQSSAVNWGDPQYEDGTFDVVADDEGTWDDDCEEPSA